MPQAMPSHSTDPGCEKRLILTMLTGDEEVPPRLTDAHGQAHVRLSKDGQSMDYVLVANRFAVNAAPLPDGRMISTVRRCLGIGD